MSNSMTATGLTAIDIEISKSFLSLRPTIAKHDSPEIIRCYASLIDAFDKLCNLNIRDREFANRIINTLKNSAISAAYPEILNAVLRWGAGDLNEARSCFACHSELHPTDFVGLFMLHIFDFLHGSCDRYVEYLIADDRCNDPVFGDYYKGMLSFAFCEQGDVEAGFRYGREACDKNDRDDIYAVHALVHCWHTIGDHISIVSFLRSRSHHWYKNPGMNIHVNWHLAVSLLCAGNNKDAISAYHQLRSLSLGHHAEQDLDAVNFCVRLFLTSIPRPEFLSEHQTLAHNWAPSIYNSLSYFNDAHAAIAFMLAGDKPLMQKLLNRPQISILDTRRQKVGESLLHAINDFMNEDYQLCIAKFEETRPDWYLIGGSSAQREIFDVIANAARALHGGALLRKPAI